MTENEAKEKLQAYIECQERQEPVDVLEQCDKDCDCCELCYAQGLYEEHKEAVQMAIKALEEIQQYRAIGTPEECRTAVEKQTAKRPDYEGDGYADGQLIYDTWVCPCCGRRYEVDYDEYDYCPYCGQKLRLER